MSGQGRGGGEWTGGEAVSGQGGEVVNGQGRGGGKWTGGGGW